MKHIAETVQTNRSALIEPSKRVHNSSLTSHTLVFQPLFRSQSTFKGGEKPWVD